MAIKITDKMIRNAVRRTINEASFNFKTYDDDKQLSEEAMNQLQIAHNALSSLQMTLFMNQNSQLAKSISDGIKSINDEIIGMRNYITFYK